MKISYNWIKDYLDIDLPAEEVSVLLTDCGLEVEGMEVFDSIPGGLKGFVIGEIETKTKHPNADTLSLTTVNIGIELPLNVVCGAPNVAVGQKVVVATVGTTLYPIEAESFKIKKSKIRGELSEGMLCSEVELGLGTSSDGIMVLDDKTVPGLMADKYFKVQSDTIFDIGLTPNRIDAASHLGTARDLLSVLKFHKEGYAESDLNWPALDGFKVDNNSLKINVMVEDFAACPRYAGVSLSNIKVHESPDWLKARLKSIGLSPINNIVDVTNFVLHEYGQPLHAFDADKIVGNKIQVQTLPTGSVFKSLDGVERKLSENDLMICNGEVGMCIAGVFGGIESGVSEQTTSIFLESAYFNPVWVRKSAKRHSLNTDASFRFERGVDPEMVLSALKRAAILIKEIAGGDISSEIIDIYPKPIIPFNIDFDVDKCNQLIGKEIPSSSIKEILTSLDIKILEEDGNQWVLEVPSYRVDVQRQADVTEEILRIYGYNNIEFPEGMKSALSYAPKPDKEKIQHKISSLLVSSGFNEVIHNSLTKASYYEGKSLWKPEESIAMLNPLSSELSVMRQSLMFNSLEAVAYNANRRSEDIKIFEFGNVYRKEEKFKENKEFCVTVTGKREIESWNTSDAKADFYFLKGIVSNVLEKLGISASVKYEQISNDAFSGGVLIKMGQDVVGSMGRVSEKVLQEMDIKSSVYQAIFNWETLVRMAAKRGTKFKEVSKYPEMRRDLALLIDEVVTFEEIENIARKTEKSLLKAVAVFDVFRGNNVPKGKKSYAISFVFRDEKKTLTDQSIDQIMDKLISNYKEKLGAELR